MNGWTETHRSFVNTWECDENVHLNVQFYLKRFDEASRIQFMLARPEKLHHRLPKTRHVRFHKELRPAVMTSIVSSVVGDGPFAGWIVHHLEDRSSRQSAATAMDSPGPAGISGTVAASDVAFALPRGLPAADLMPLPPEWVVANGGLIANRSVVQPNECDSRREMMQQHYVSRFTDAAPHVWESIGIGEPWLTSRGYGRVAVEMKITHHRPAMTDDVIFLYSNAQVNGRKTIKLRHEVVRQFDLEPVASCEVLALIMDLESRKSVPLPNDLLSRWKP